MVLVAGWATVIGFAVARSNYYPSAPAAPEDPAEFENFLKELNAAAAAEESKV